MVDFRGEKRSNATHESSTDPEAKFMTKGDGQPAKLSFGAHALRAKEAQGTGRPNLAKLDNRAKERFHEAFFNGLLTAERSCFGTPRAVSCASI
jgi:hypothetical protein